MLKDNKKIIQQYENLSPSYQVLFQIIEKMLNRALSVSDFDPMQVSGRIKTKESLSEKLLRKAGKYDNITDIKDIIGFRVLFYYSDQVDIFAKVIESIFCVDQYNSIDKRQVLPDIAFGYTSLHYVCTLPEGQGYPDQLCGLPFEIQLRTVLQHTWAAIEYDLGYKTDISVPREIRREFARIASLLEIADERFVAVRQQIMEYRHHTQEFISNDLADDMTLDLETLSEFISKSTTMSTLVADIAAFCKASIRYVTPESYLDKLQNLGILTIKDLKTACIKNRNAILSKAEQLLRDSDIEELVSTVGLYYLCRVLES